MSTLEQAARQALEALERWRDWDDCNNTAAFGLDDEDAITALRDALTEPVRTKDLTDDELIALWESSKECISFKEYEDCARAVIAADRENNK